MRRTATGQAEQNARALRGLELTGGKYVTVALPASSTKTFYHGLGRTPSGWIICDVQASSAMTRVIYRSAWDNKSISLVNDMGQEITLKLLVF